MRRTAKLAAILLTMSLGVTTLLAQRGMSDNSGNKSSGRSTASAASTNRGSMRPQGRSLGFQPSPPYVNPFQQQIHLNGPGAGCMNCGYSTYGGYVYSGYAGQPMNPMGPTATDAILANGGTFNNINATQQDAQPAPPPQAPPQVIYIRPDYPTQYSDNATVNSPVQTPVASAASASPALLIFKDGTQMTIHNYAIYGAFIVVLTPERQRFPIAALDIAATQKANEAAGYDLKLPAVFEPH